MPVFLRTYWYTFTDEEQRYISDTYIFSDEGSTSDQEDAVVIDKVFIGEAECISYGLYSEELAIADSYMNWISSEAIPSPIKEINDDNNPTYKMLDAKAV